MPRPPATTVPEDLIRTPVEYDTPKRKDNLFLWTVFLLLLVGFSMVCWIGSYLVFSRPELPISYKLLRKIHKIDPPARFAVNAAPHGEFLTPEKLYSRYHAMTGSQMRDANRALERNFLRNYPVSNEQVPYVTGRFTLMDSYELQGSDFAPAGVVSVAVSADDPRLLIEHLYTANPEDAPRIKGNLQTGMDIELRRTFELSAVLHAAKLKDGHILLTVAPLNYGKYVFTGAGGGFELHPPETLNVAAGLPVVRGVRLEAANSAYVDFRTRAGFGPFTGKPKDAGGKAPLTALKGVDAPLQPVASPAPGGKGAVAAASPSLSPGSTAKPAVAEAAKPPPAAPPAASATPALVARNDVPVMPAFAVPDSPRHAPAPQTVAIKPAPSGNGSALQPFLAGGDTPLPPPAAAARKWATYPAGRAPGGKSVQAAEVPALNKDSLTDAPVYLTGQFVVRATGENRATGLKTAVMRSSRGESNVRVLVEFPSDRALPAEGVELTRDTQRPLLITGVRRGEDGIYNVTAREISEP